MYEPPRDRLFFALLPPPRLARSIATAARWFDRRGTVVDATRLHITMFILDDFLVVPPAVIGLLTRAGDAIAAAAIDVSLDVAIGSGRSVALRPRARDAALVGLHRQLARLVMEAGLTGRDGYRFDAHMTLGYVDGPFFRETVPPIVWRAEEIVLIHSHLGRTRHEIVGRWPLTAAGEEQLALF